MAKPALSLAPHSLRRFVRGNRYYYSVWHTTVPTEVQ
jgi:hypothetical protein